VYCTLWWQSCLSVCTIHYVVYDTLSYCHKRVYCTKYNYTNIYKTYCHYIYMMYWCVVWYTLLYRLCRLDTPNLTIIINSILVVLLYADRRAANMLAVTSQQHQPRKRPALAPVDPLPSSSSTTTNNSSKSNRTATTHQHNTKTVCKIVWT